jgi:prepilin-type N-terminal cleavage/methylation domain-containing protein
MQHERSEAGFTLIEVMVASAVLVVGVLAVAYGMTVGAVVVATAQQDTIARQKAREALEDVFTARDTANITFSQICNVGSGASCIFVAGSTPLTLPGDYGLVNTTNPGPVEWYYSPGPDGILGTADDVKVTLSGFTRQIQITQLSGTLVQITVTVQYTTEGGLTRSVTVTALMSPYS